MKASSTSPISLLPLFLLLLHIYLNLLLVATEASKDLPVVRSERDYDFISHFQLQKVLLSSDFLTQLECVWKYIPELRRQTHNDDYDHTIWELKEITENIPFQAFLSRLNILQSVKAVSASQTAVHMLLANEYAALSKIKARLTGKLEKLRPEYDLKMYQLDTLQKELDHINTVRKHIQNLEETRRSRLISIMVLENKIRSSERLISRQKELLASYGGTVVLPVLHSPKFQPLKAWGSVKSSGGSDEEVWSNISHDDIVSQKDVHESETSSESDDETLTKCSSDGAKITSRGSRCQSISSELAKIYSFEKEKGPKKRKKWWRLSLSKK